MSKNDENNAAAGDNNNGDKNQPVFQKGMSLDKLKEKFTKKLDTAKGKAFEQKFEAKFKELDAAEAIVAGINKELEKMYVEFNEGL